MAKNPDDVRLKNLVPGNKRGPGKVTTALREAILAAAEEAGGEGGTVGYLTRQAIENPGPFLALLGKIIPTTLATNPGEPLEIRTNPAERLREVIDAIAARGAE